MINKEIVEIKVRYDQRHVFQTLDTHNIKARRAARVLMYDFVLDASDVKGFYTFFEALPEDTKRLLSSSQLAETYYSLRAPTLSGSSDNIQMLDGLEAEMLEALEDSETTFGFR